MRLLKCNNLRTLFTNVIVFPFPLIAALTMSVLVTGCSGQKQKLVIEQAGYAEQSETAGSEHLSGENSPEEEPEEAFPPAEEQKLAVFVCGAVSEEGVYLLAPGSRICDAIAAAGGFSEEADTSWLNLALCVEDGQQIRVPTLEEGQRLREGELLQMESGAGEGSVRVNINTADAQELQKLPGIGEVRADRIIAYRKEHGSFGETGELRDVSGIGEALFQEIKDYITVGDPR